MVDPIDVKLMVAQAAIDEVERRAARRREFVLPIVPKDVTMADTMYDRLMSHIADFQRDLDPEHEVGACLAYFGKEVLIHIESLGYQNPGLIVLYGFDGEGHRVTLLQHMTQVNLLLVALPPLKGEEPRRIGFTAPSDEEHSAP
jgi:hypothetical protein